MSRTRVYTAMEHATATTKDRKRRWVFTLNNYSAEEAQALLDCTDAVKHIFFGEEVAPSTGTPHFQGYVEFLHPKTMSAVKKTLGSDRYWLAVAKGTPFEGYQYALKDGTPLLSYGEVPEETYSAEGGTWEAIVAMVKEGFTYLEIVERFPNVAVQQGTAIQRFKIEWENSLAGWRDVKTTYVSGSTGVGKTRGIMDAYGYSNVYRVTNYNNPFDQYQGEPVIVFEEFRNSVKIEDMLNFLDGYPVRLPCRYADRMAMYTRVFIVTNWTYDEQYQNIADRYPETYAAFTRRIDEWVHLTSVEKAEEFKSGLLTEQNQDEEE